MNIRNLSKSRSTLPSPYMYIYIFFFSYKLFIWKIYNTFFDVDIRSRVVKTKRVRMNLSPKKLTITKLLALNNRRILVASIGETNIHFLDEEIFAISLSKKLCPSSFFFLFIYRTINYKYRPDIAEISTRWQIATLIGHLPKARTRNFELNARKKRASFIKFDDFFFKLRLLYRKWKT